MDGSAGKTECDWKIFEHEWNSCCFTKKCEDLTTEYLEIIQCCSIISTFSLSILNFHYFIQSAALYVLFI